MCPKKDSSRPYIIFTGRSQWSASMHAWTCIERSSRPPNAPPTPPSTSRTFSGGRSSEAASWSLVDVQPLGGDEEVHAAVLGRHGEAGLRPEEGLVLHADLVLAGDHDLALGVRVAVADRHVAQQVAARVQRRDRRVERALGVGQRLEHLVVDLDLLGRRARGLGVVGGDDRDRLALVADVLPREHRLVVDLQPVGLAAGHVLVR